MTGLARLRTEPTRMPRAPGFPVPEGACDAHTHVFGPLSSYPTGPSTYPIPLATPPILRMAMQAIQVRHAVLVQPAPYGTDTGALEHALHLGGRQLAGIAAAKASTSDATLDRLHRLGVRGLRFNERIDPRSGKRFHGAVGADDLGPLLPRLRELGWHAQLWASLTDCLRLVDKFAGRGVPLVLDHMAQVEPGRGVHDREFRQLVDRVQAGDVWVKLTICRISRKPGYDDVQPFHDALLEANPDRLLWGSDWPYVAMGADAPDAGRLLGLFANWTADPNLIHRILVGNPRRLFDFADREIC